MSKLPKLSGEEVIKILIKHFGFEVKRVKGSHVVLCKVEEGRKVVTIVPLHKEIKRGTLLGILRLAGIDKDVFMEKI